MSRDIAAAERMDDYELQSADLLGASHVVAFGYARHALIALLESCATEGADQVVLSVLTCKVVPLALLSVGLEPVYADVAAGGLNLDPAAAEAACTSRTAAILFQYTYGTDGGARQVAEVARRRGVPLIADRAQCMPIRDPGQPQVPAIYSNNLVKPLPAASGGLAATDDPELAEGLARRRDGLAPLGPVSELRLRAEAWVQRRLLRSRTYWPLYALQRRLSSQYRGHDVAREIDDEIRRPATRPSRWQRVAGRRWLARAEEVAARRREACEDYGRALRDQPGAGAWPGATGRALYYYPVIADDKPGLLDRARRARVEIVAWPGRTPIFAVDDPRRLPDYGYRPGSCPRAEELAASLVGLPTRPDVGPAERARIIAVAGGRPS